MKKNRLLFLLPLIASFVLTSCDLLNNLNFNGPRKRSSEEDSEVSLDYDSYLNKPSSNQSSNQKTSSRTTSSSTTNRSSSSSTNKSSSSSAHTHNWTEWVVTNEPTCVSTGQQERRCTICGVVQTQNIPMVDHVWTEWEIVQEATCTESGFERRQCAVCALQQARSLAPFGHDYDLENATWRTEPSCTNSGVGTAICKRCGIQQTITIDAYGHSYSLINPMRTPSGMAEALAYRCDRCGDTYLNFDINALSADSKNTLVIENGGARFFGHPIGNDVALNEYGSADSDNHEAVFNDQSLGDYFEFKFYLTANQARAFSTCRLYCDATPAPYLQGMDFWARRPSDDEWTAGYYIEGENKGYEITNYRYALYVDGQQVEFDTSISTTVTQQEARREFMMPYLFNLHEGNNSIRLHMAGGYRSTFYNFTFRPCDNPDIAHVHAWGEAELIAAYSEGYVGYAKSTCLADGATQLSINFNEGTLADGSMFKTGTINGYYKLNTNGSSVSYKFMYEGRSTTAKLYQFGCMDAWSSNYAKGYTSTTTSGSGQTLGPTGCNFGVNFNSEEVEIDEAAKNATYEELLAGATLAVDSSNCSNAGPCLIGEINLVTGENVLTYTRYASYNLNISQLLIVIE